MNNFEETNLDGEQSNPVDDSVSSGEENFENFAPTEFYTVNRSTSILLLGFVIVAVGFIYFMRIRSGPNAAMASAESVTAKATITDFLSNGGQNIKQMRDMLRNTEQVVQQFTSQPNDYTKFVELRNNPFVFPKKATGPGDDEKAAARQRAEVMKALQQLQLQSIIHSENLKACMIGNKLYHEGEQVDRFTVEKITPTSVIVHYGNSRYELKIVK